MAKPLLDPAKPVAVWRSMDLLGNRPVPSLTVILRTSGCRWNRCTICGFASQGAPATSEDLMSQFHQAIQRLQPGDGIVKIYTSGSFLDPREVPEAAREGMLELIRGAGIRRLIIESRPEHINGELVRELTSKVETEFAIGLETANDLIREEIIQKGFTFQDFVSASRTVHSNGGRVKAYLLLKPPLLHEGGAIEDAVSSAEAARGHADIISLNLCNVQRGTVVERLWERGEYRPPWLWSAVEVLRRVEGPIICDPVGAGARRGPHNCGRCDSAVAEAIRRHALTQDRGLFDGLDCGCRAAWRKVVELEERAFGAPLA